MIDTGLEPTNNIGVGFQKVLVAHELKGIQESGNDANISQRHLMSDQIGLVEQISVQYLQGVTKIRLGLFVPVKEIVKKVCVRERQPMNESAFLL